MKINHENLVALGFTRLNEKVFRYHYFDDYPAKEMVYGTTTIQGFVYTCCFMPDWDEYNWCKKIEDVIRHYKHHLDIDLVPISTKELIRFITSRSLDPYKNEQLTMYCIKNGIGNYSDQYGTTHWNTDYINNLTDQELINHYHHIIDL